jgi:hypothetical protein
MAIAETLSERVCRAHAAFRRLGPCGRLIPNPGPCGRLIPNPGQSCVSSNSWHTLRIYEDLKGELGLDHYVRADLCVAAGRRISVFPVRGARYQSRRPRKLGARRCVPELRLRRADDPSAHVGDDGIRRRELESVDAHCRATSLEGRLQSPECSAMRCEPSTGASRRPVSVPMPHLRRRLVKLGRSVACGSSAPPDSW